MIIRFLQISGYYTIDQDMKINMVKACRDGGREQNSEETTGVKLRR